MALPAASSSDPPGNIGLARSGSEPLHGSAGDRRSPVEGVDAPTLTEEGVDLVFTNWRGIVAPPGLSDAKQKEYIDLLTKMHGSEQWKKVLKDQGWTDSFETGATFKTFLGTENERVAGVLKDLGLA